MAEAWTPPEPSHYERAEAALTAIRPGGQPDLQIPPVDSEIGLGYLLKLGGTFAGAAIHSLLAIADVLADMSDELTLLRRGEDQ